MRKLYIISLYSVISFFLSSCKFECSVGDKMDTPKGDAKVVDGARIYNDIQLEQHGVKVEKAYLKLKDGDPLPQSNVVEFNQPVQLVMFIEEGGWKETDNKVHLGVSETIKAPNGDTLLNEPDLFLKYPEGLSPKDARTITITATIIIKQKLEPLSTFTVLFRVWDKDSSSYIQGSYKLFSK